LSQRFDLAVEGRGLSLIRTVGEDDIDPSPGEVDGGVTAKPTASARDDCDLVRHTFSIGNTSYSSYITILEIAGVLLSEVRGSVFAGPLS
jgi:hypothetical protein